MFGIIALFILIVIIFGIIYITLRNSGRMNKMYRKLFSLLKKNGFNIKEIDQDEFKKITIYGIINFYPKGYIFDEIGIISTMTVNIGIMQMLTINFNPFEKDLYELNVDLIYIFNKRKFLFEFYNLILDKDNQKNKLFLTKINKINEKYLYLPNYKMIKGWLEPLIAALISKIGISYQEEELFNLYQEIIATYIEYAKQMPKIKDDDLLRKNSLIKDFGNNLVNNGGVAIDTFKKSIGVEKTKQFLGKVFFGYNIYNDLKMNKKYNYN